MNATTIDGGCVCGEVRYQVSASPIHRTSCHCENCRRASGAPFVAWFTVARCDFQVVEGAPAQYPYVREDGHHAVRSFCRRCGTQLTYEVDGRPDEIEVTTGSSDDPESLVPTQEVHADETLSWV